jgi:hypothetical protein
MCCISFSTILFSTKLNELISILYLTNLLFVRNSLSLFLSLFIHIKSFDLLVILTTMSNEVTCILFQSLKDTDFSHSQSLPQNYILPSRHGYHHHREKNYYSYGRKAPQKCDNKYWNYGQRQLNV